MTRRLLPYSSACRWAVVAGVVVGSIAFSAYADEHSAKELNGTAAALYFVIALGCLAFSALFSGSETAFLSANLPKLEAEAELATCPRAKRLPFMKKGTRPGDYFNRKQSGERRRRRLQLCGRAQPAERVVHEAAGHCEHLCDRIAAASVWGDLAEVARARLS